MAVFSGRTVGTNLSLSNTGAGFTGIKKVALQDPHVALILLRMCGSFSKLSHIAHTTPPTIATDELGLFDHYVKNCLSECLAIEMPPKAREQAQLSL